MRPVLMVLGIAVLAIIIAVLVTPSRDLTPSPQERDDARREAQNKADLQRSQASDKFNPPREGVITAVMSVKDRGDVTMEFYPKAAPKTVDKLARLIKAGYYNGMKFHRVVPDFVVQCGEPASRTQPFADTKLAEETIPFERNNLPHMPGTLGVALTAPASDTGNSQFFINLKANHNLDGSYCVFGSVTQGMDVVKQIQQGDVITGIAIR